MSIPEIPGLCQKSQVTEHKALSMALSPELEPLAAIKVAVVQLDLALGRD